MLTIGIAKRYGSRKCLGYRSYNAEGKTWGPYEWIDYATIHQRRANFGVGLVEVNRQAGITGTKYGVGLWCQNRPEWQITGKDTTDAIWSGPNRYRSGLHEPVSFHSIPLRNAWARRNPVHHQSRRASLCRHFPITYTNVIEAKAAIAFSESHCLARSINKQ